MGILKIIFLQLYYHNANEEADRQQSDHEAYEASL